MNENKEYITHPDEMGCIHISEDVVCAVAASAAAEVDGVSAMMNASGKKGAARGVKIAASEERMRQLIETKAPISELRPLFRARYK